MTIETGDVLKVILDYVYPGAGTALNIFHYVYSGAVQEDEDILTALEDWAINDWGDEWSDLAGDTATLDTAKVQQVTSQGEVLRDVGTIVLGITGDAMTGPLPAANSCYLQANTDVPQIRGSKYAPAMSEESVEDGAFTINALASIALLLVAYLKRINLGPGDNLDPGVISIRNEGFKSLEQTGAFNNLPAYQRRRKEGVGS